MEEPNSLMQEQCYGAKELDSPTRELNYGAGELNSSLRELNYGARELNSPTREVVTPREELGYATPSAAFLTSFKIPSSSHLTNSSNLIIRQRRILNFA